MESLVYGVFHRSRVGEVRRESEVGGVPLGVVSFVFLYTTSNRILGRHLPRSGGKNRTVTGSL